MNMQENKTGKTKMIIGWALSAIAALSVVASAVDKIYGSEHAIAMSTSFGLSPETYRWLGIVELISMVLFAIPGTGILGVMLLTSYFGGAIATHLQHQQDILFPVVFEIIIWIAATLRYPELSGRLAQVFKR